MNVQAVPYPFTLVRTPGGPIMRNIGNGLYRDRDGLVMVDYGRHRAPIPRDQYQARDYTPLYGQLPTREQYEAAKKGKE
jgi:hypothetical protein